MYFFVRAVPVLLLVLLTLALAACSGSSSPSINYCDRLPVNPVGANLTQVSSDPYTVGPGQHATEVEPHMLSNGSTLVAAFQTGRIVSRGRDRHRMGDFYGWRHDLDPWLSARLDHRRRNWSLRRGERSGRGLRREAWRVDDRVAADFEYFADSGCGREPVDRRRITWQSPVSVDRDRAEFRQELDRVRQLGREPALWQLLC